MAGRRIADVVFCLDASASMKPCFSALQEHLGAFVEGLQADFQGEWDVRFDFLAYQTDEDRSGNVFCFQSFHHKDGAEVLRELYARGGDFFTKDAHAFQRRLGELKAERDEASFYALDICLDFPWREGTTCHRVVVLLTDEPLETGLLVKEQIDKIPQLNEKLHKLRVKLFLVGPSSDAFDALCAADRSEYQVVDGHDDGLRRVDFHQILGEIGKSVSVSQLQSTSGLPAGLRGLFGQASWGSRSAPPPGGDKGKR